MDLNKMINEALANIEASGFVEKKVQERLEQTIASIVEDLFRDYGDFGRALKEKVKGELNINLEGLKLDDYNLLILEAVKEKIDQTVRLQGIEKIKAGLDKMLTMEKQETTLSELIELLKDEALENNEELRGEELSLHVDKSSTSLSFVYFDENPGKEKYRCNYRLTVKADGTVIAVYIEDKKLSKKTLMEGLYGFEEELLKIYASGSKLIIDEGNVDTYYSEHED